MRIGNRVVGLENKDHTRVVVVVTVIVVVHLATVREADVGIMRRKNHHQDPHPLKMAVIRMTKRESHHRREVKVQVVTVSQV